MDLMQISVNEYAEPSKAGTGTRADNVLLCTSMHLLRYRSLTEKQEREMFQVRRIVAILHV